MPWCAHDDEYSNAIANRSSRTDVLDSHNGGVNDIGIGPGNGSAPGSSGPGEPHEGDDEHGIPYGVS
jgi:hypothetical protein